MNEPLSPETLDAIEIDQRETVIAALVDQIRLLNADSESPETSRGEGYNIADLICDLAQLYVCLTV